MYAVCLIADVKVQSLFWNGFNDKTHRKRSGMGRQVNLRYTKNQLLTLYNAAWIENVERGGRYDTPPAAIEVWTPPWTTPEERQVTTLKGRLYLDWTRENQLTEIAVAEGFSESDILDELAILEKEALGRIIHGQMSK